MNNGNEIISDDIKPKGRKIKPNRNTTKKFLISYPNGAPLENALAAANVINPENAPVPDDIIQEANAYHS